MEIEAQGNEGDYSNQDEEETDGAGAVEPRSVLPTWRNALNGRFEEPRKSILDSSLTIMKHMEFVTGRTSTQLVVENEHFWKLYGINALTLSELAGRTQGTRQQQTAPID